MPNVSIENLDKAAVLKALHDASKAPENERQFCPMSEAMAQRFIAAGQTRFDYVNRRALKFDIGGSEFDATAYDEVNGAGVAESAVAALRGPVTVADAQSEPVAEAAPPPQQEAEPAPPEVEATEDPDPAAEPEPEKSEFKASTKRPSRKRS